MLFKESIRYTAAIVIPLTTVEMPRRLCAPQLQGFPGNLPFNVRGHTFQDDLQPFVNAKWRLNWLSSFVENQGGLFWEFICIPPDRSNV